MQKAQSALDFHHLWRQIEAEPTTHSRSCRPLLLLPLEWTARWSDISTTDSSKLIQRSARRSEGRAEEEDSRKRKKRRKSREKKKEQTNAETRKEPAREEGEAKRERNRERGEGESARADREREKSVAREVRESHAGRGGLICERTTNISPFPTPTERKVSGKR